MDFDGDADDDALLYDWAAAMEELVQCEDDNDMVRELDVVEHQGLFVDLFSSLA